MEENEMEIKVSSEGEKVSVGNVYGVKLVYFDDFKPELKEWERAADVLRTSIEEQAKTSKEWKQILENGIYPIDIALIECGCKHVIEKPEDLKNALCKHGNHFINIKKEKKPNGNNN